MKSIVTYIYESSNKSISEKRFCELAQLQYNYNNTAHSIYCGERNINEKSLQFHNGKWIYGYSVYYDGTSQLKFPIIGVHTEEEYDDDTMSYNTKGVKGFIMNNEDDVKTFGEHCMNGDNSIFNVDIVKDKVQCKSDNFDATEKEAYNQVNKDNSIIWVSVGSYSKNDFYVTLRYKK